MEGYTFYDLLKGLAAKHEQLQSENAKLISEKSSGYACASGSYFPADGSVGSPEHASGDAVLATNEYEADGSDVPYQRKMPPSFAAADWGMLQEATNCSRESVYREATTIMNSPKPEGQALVPQMASLKPPPEEFALPDGEDDLEVSEEGNVDLPRSQVRSMPSLENVPTFIGRADSTEEVGRADDRGSISQFGQQQLVLRVSSTSSAMMGNVSQTMHTLSFTAKRLQKQFERLVGSDSTLLFTYQCVEIMEETLEALGVRSTLLTQRPLIVSVAKALTNFSMAILAESKDAGHDAPGAKTSDISQNNSLRYIQPHELSDPGTVGINFETFQTLVNRDQYEIHKLVDPEDYVILMDLKKCLRRESKHFAATLASAAINGRQPTPVDDYTGNLVDTVSAFVIMINAVILGISSDRSPKSSVWSVLEIVFATFFLGEMGVKMRRLGLRRYFLGEDWRWNNFDFVVICLALFEQGTTLFLHIEAAISGTQKGKGIDLSDIAIIKILRLGRLARLVRLLRFKIFHELKMMIQGVIAGLRVLFWAVVLLVFFIYIIGLVARKTMGTSTLADPIFEKVTGIKDRNYATYHAFEDVMTSMFTLFRCFTDGCSAFDGSPLTVHLYRYYGDKFLVGYFLTSLFVTIGIFNLIMAIFIDNVMAASTQRKQKERGANAAVMECKLKDLVLKLAKNAKPAHNSLVDGALAGVNGLLLPKDEKITRVEKDLSLANQALDTLDEDEITITREVFQAWLQEPEMLAMLDDLDIGTANKAELFDVLDCDLSGELEVPEVISGLMKLRGPSDKSDAVASLLGIRYVTKMLEAVHNQVLECSDENSRSTTILASLARTSMLAGVHRSRSSTGKYPGKGYTHAASFDSTSSLSVPRHTRVAFKDSPDVRGACCFPSKVMSIIPDGQDLSASKIGSVTPALSFSDPTSCLCSSNTNSNLKVRADETLATTAGVTL